MPEILEVEMYRRGAEPVTGRRIGSVDAPDAWYLKGSDAPSLIGVGGLLALSVAGEFLYRRIRGGPPGEPPTGPGDET